MLWWYFAYCRWTEEDLFSLFQVKQRDADKVDLWLTNSFLLPLTVMNASLSQKLQGVMKVCTHVMIGSDYSKLSLHLCQINSEMGQTHYIPTCYHKSQFRTGLDTKVSAAPCLSGDELQRSTHISPGLLVYPVPPAAQQDPPCQPDIHSESGYQPGKCPAHSPSLSIYSFQGKMPTVVSR